MPRRILSIAAAPGWKARFLAENELGQSRVVALVSWALVEGADGTAEVVGVVQRASTTEKPNGWLGFADEVEGFQGYTFAGPATPPDN